MNALNEQHGELYQRFIQSSKKKLQRWIKGHSDVFGVLYYGESFRVFDPKQSLTVVLARDTEYLQRRRTLLDQLDAFVAAYLRRSGAPPARSWEPPRPQTPSRSTTVDELFQASKAMLCLQPDSGALLGRFHRGDFVRCLRANPSVNVLVCPPVYHVELMD